MEKIDRRSFGKKTLLVSCLTAAGVPAAAHAFFDKVKKDAFLKRDDIAHAVKSYYMTYDCTKPYPHKFNEVLAKQQMRSLQFHIDHGTEKDYVEHYLRTAKPLLESIKKAVAQGGGEKGLAGMFEDNPCSYQLFERIDAAPGRRGFPCPYKELLGYCKQYLETFTLEWQDVCNRWCVPTWSGSADAVGIKLDITPGETCSVSLKS